MSRTTAPNTTLITGIPRSGTTLCCKLINECSNSVALHEPIDPHKLSSLDPMLAVDEIADQIGQIRNSLESNQAIEHGDKSGLALDNPIGLSTDKNGLRLQTANRGELVVPAINSSTQLYIKQNALFTALAGGLKAHYPIIAVTRNPIDVLLSWMTVSLPVNKGRLPAGEKYDLRLAEQLNSGSVIARQIQIYRWFIECFRVHRLCTVRYEDIIETGGRALYSIIGNDKNKPLQPPARDFSEDTISIIEQHWYDIRNLGIDAGYTKTLLDERFNQLCDKKDMMKLGLSKLLRKKQDLNMNPDGLVIIDNGTDNTISIEEGTLFTASRIEINGNNNTVRILKNREINRLSIKLRGNAKAVSIGGGTKIINNLKFTSIRGENQKLAIGDNFSCGGLEIQMNDGDENCVIGNDCLFSWGIKLRTSDGHSIVDMATNKAINLPEDVIIGDRVWCSEDVKFLKGCAVAKETIIGSGSIVTKKFDRSNCIVAGIPAKVVKENVRWDRRMPYEFNENNA